MPFTGDAVNITYAGSQAVVGHVDPEHLEKVRIS